MDDKYMRKCSTSFAIKISGISQEKGACAYNPNYLGGEDQGMGFKISLGKKFVRPLHHRKMLAFWFASVILVTVG
jgi:hypothetical protein